MTMLIGAARHLVGRKYTIYQWDADAAALLVRMSLPQDLTTRPINELVLDLKAAGVWAKLDVLYVTAAPTALAARQNWKSNSFQITEVNSPIFQANIGYTGNGTSSYLNTNWSPAANGVNYTGNNAHASVFVQNDRLTATGTLIAYGAAVSGGIYLRFEPKQSAGFRFRINASASISTFQNTAGTRGFYTLCASGPSEDRLYRDATLVTSVASAHAGSPQMPCFLLCTNSNGSPTFFSSDTISAFSAGAALLDAEVSSYSLAIDEYMHAVGAL